MSSKLDVEKAADWIYLNPQPKRNTPQTLGNPNHRRRPRRAAQRAAGRRAAGAHRGRSAGQRLGA